MKFKVTQKQLIIANILLFVVSLCFLEFFKLFRMSQEQHWIYSWGHTCWFFVGIPSAFYGSLILGIYSLWKVNKHKFLYLISSLIPLILFILFISV